MPWAKSKKLLKATRFELSIQDIAYSSLIRNIMLYNDLFIMPNIKPLGLISYVFKSYQKDIGVVISSENVLVGVYNIVR